jgi:hypothetical protein
VSKIAATEKFEVGNVDASAARLLGESSANAPLSVQHTLVMRPPPPAARAAAHADKPQPPPPTRPPPAAFATCAQSERVAREFEAALEQVQEAALSAAKAMEPGPADADGAPRPILLKKKDLAAVSRLSMLSFSRWVE